MVESYNPEALPSDPSAIVPRILESVEKLCDNQIELSLSNSTVADFRFSSEASQEEFGVSLKGRDREAFEHCLSQIDQ